MATIKNGKRHKSRAEYQQARERAQERAQAARREEHQAAEDGGEDDADRDVRRAAGDAAEREEREQRDDRAGGPRRLRDAARGYEQEQVLQRGGGAGGVFALVARGPRGEGAQQDEAEPRETESCQQDDGCGQRVHVNARHSTATAPSRASAKCARAGAGVRAGA